MNMPEKINLNNKLTLIDELWSPKVIGQVNDSLVKLAKVRGDYCWHSHDGEDELFMVISGELRIELRDGELLLKNGEIAIIPQGVEHKPVAEKETHILLIEQRSTINTGAADDARKISPDELEWI